MNEFRPVTVDDLPHLRTLYARCASRVGDISPLLCVGYGYELREAMGLCWLRQPDGCYLPPMGTEQREDWCAVFEACVPPQTAFRYVPETLLQGWQAQLGEAISVTENRGMWDYILDTAHMVTASGGGLADYRRHIHQFERLYPDAVVAVLTEADLPELLAFDREAQALLETRATQLSSVQADAAAFVRILPYWSHPESHLHGVCVRIGGRLVAAAIGEDVGEGAFTAFYKRCDYTYKGVNAYITRAYAEMQCSLGVTRTNLMQDENEPQLRSFKQSLDPVEMLRKSAVYYEPMKG